MSFIHQHIQSAKKIIEQYQGDMPLSAYLKNYFSANKKFGSKDRKQISNLCFSYYRLGNGITDISFEEHIKAALFLCNDEIRNEWNDLFSEAWKTNWVKSLHGRLNFIETQFQNFSTDNFAQSHLIQPDLFLRIRPGKEKQVINKLTEANISLQQTANNCIALANTTKVDELIIIDEEAVVQDYSSQRVQELLSSVIFHQSFKVWDCCAASGGKSILAKDILGNIDLTVSDVRPSILQNLQRRFAKAGIKKYNSFIADISNSTFEIRNSKFDLIICDAPCSGSGTWGRTPEQLLCFKKEKISYYANLQKQIVSNAIKLLQENGYFLYITCSVFKQENEAVVEFIQEEFHLELVKMELLKGYDKKADTMFAALFRKTSIPLSE
jgi:16S rRNA (cytosine967-C5)-methyltransferase